MSIFLFIAYHGKVTAIKLYILMLGNARKSNSTFKFLSFQKESVMLTIMYKIRM